MRSDSGVTLVYLVLTIIIMLIIASITVSGSLTAYRTMKYETFKAELQEVQEAVLEISEDFAMYKKDNSSASYSDYFTAKFSSIPTLATASSDSNVSIRVSKYDLNEDYTYYFTTDDLATYMGLEVSVLKAVLVDFSTATVCSVEGVVDPDDGSTYYYTLSDSESNGDTIYKNETESSSSGVTVSPATDAERTTVGNTTLLTVTLTLNQDGDGTDYPIKKAYYSTDGGSTYIEVDSLGDCEYSSTTVSFVIYDAGTYYFKIEDTSGETVTSDEIKYK